MSRWYAEFDLILLTVIISFGLVELQQVLLIFIGPLLYAVFHQVLLIFIILIYILILIGLL